MTTAKTKVANLRPADATAGRTQKIRAGDSTDLLRGVTDDTLGRVAKSCAEAGMGSWQALIVEAELGTVFNVSFADRRPTDFVSEFALLVRGSGLKFRADRALDLFLGTPAILERMIEGGGTPRRVALSALGEVAEDEIDRVTLSGARRSAGVTYDRREKSRSLAGKSVMILDDDPVARQILTTALERSGCAVSAVGEAEAAFSILKETRPDVVVLDIVLGGTLDGFDFCRAMRANPQCADIPAIFVTGHTEAQYRDRAESVLASAYFDKPVKPNRLCEAVMQLSRASQLGAA